MDFNTICFILRQAVYCMIPLLVAAIGGMFSERGGVQNMALEGLMIIGAFCGTYFIRIMQAHGFSGQWVLILALLIGGLAGLLLSLLHAFACINMHAHQVISGIAINLLAPALCIIVAKATLGVLQVGYTNTFRVMEVPRLSKIPLLGQVLFTKTYLTTLVGFLVWAAALFVLYRTRFGMRLRACGENPHAADSVGVNVYRYRYKGVMISGFLCGLAGVTWVIPNATEFGAAVGGYGFLALAVLCFGQWKPNRILLASFFFALFKTVSYVYTGIPLLLNSGINSYVFKMVPYIATVLVLAIFSDKSGEPAALGKIYIKNGK